MPRKIKSTSLVAFVFSGQLLTTLYSYDTWMGYEKQEEGEKWRKKHSTNKYSHSPTNVSEEGQNMLWDLEHSATEHIPRKLSLCIGMPVMIRHNTATELCITNGQESTVEGWYSKPGRKEMLETLFVKLTDPPKSNNSSIKCCSYC